MRAKSYHLILFLLREAVRIICLQLLEELSEMFVLRLQLWFCNCTTATQQKKNIAVWGGVEGQRYRGCFNLISC